MACRNNDSTLQNPAYFTDIAYALTEDQAHCHPDDQCYTGCCVPIEKPDCKPHVRYRLCTDADGCCFCVNEANRDPFWPSFSHPTWLSCKDLYPADTADDQDDQNDCD